MVHSFIGNVPSGVVSIASVSASVGRRVLHMLWFLIGNARFDVHQTMAHLLVLGVAGNSNRRVPCRMLYSEQITVNSVLNNVGFIVDVFSDLVMVSTLEILHILRVGH